MVVSIPHYSTETVFDSTISHIVYMDATTDDVLLDINMDPQHNVNAKNQNKKGNSLSREPNKTVIEINEADCKFVPVHEYRLFVEMQY